MGEPSPRLQRPQVQVWPPLDLSATWQVSPSDRGHEGAGGFADDLVAFDAATGTPLHVQVVSDAPEGAQPRLPSARGWGGAAATSHSSAALFGGLAGDDAAPVRLGDAWTVSVGSA